MSPQVITRSKHAHENRGRAKSCSFSISSIKMTSVLLLVIYFFFLEELDELHLFLHSGLSTF